MEVKGLHKVIRKNIPKIQSPGKRSLSGQWVTVMLVTSLCWWQNHYVGDFFRYVGDFFRYVGDFLYVLNRSLTS